MDLVKLLPEVLPQAIEWTSAQADHVAKNGAPLNEQGLNIARRVGVEEPEHIRIQYVDDFPLPCEQPLRDVAVHTGFIGPEIGGVTFNHSVLIRRGHGSLRLLSHEFRHVSQYENYGSIAAFLQDYLHQIAEFGYWQAPLEEDARKHEL